MTVLALDQSTTSTGVCLLVDGRVQLSESIRPKGALLDRIVEIVKRVDVIVKSAEPELVTLEEPTRLAQSAALIPLAELYGALRVTFHYRGYRDAGTRYGPELCRTQNQSTMKKFVLGNGAQKKDSSYLLEVYKKTGLTFTNDDEADAYMHAVTAAAGFDLATSRRDPGQFTLAQLSALARLPDAKVKKLSPEALRQWLASGK